MPFITPVAAQIRDDLLRDIKNLLQLTDDKLGPDSDWYVRASSVASVAEGLYQHQGWIVRQIFPDTADAEYLYLHARTRGLTRKPANSASGTAAFTGEPGSSNVAGLVFNRNNVSWTTTEDVTIGATGTGTARAVSSLAGTAGNTSAATTATLTTTPDGFDSSVIVGVMAGGTDEESDAELLARLLEIIRRPPAGGNKYDYKRWALEVAGVSAAYVYPLRRGLGTVDVAITSAGGLPSQDVVDRTQAHIDDVRPVTAKNTMVFMPVIRSFDIHVAVALDGITLQDATAAITSALQDDDVRREPGESFIRSQAGTLVSLIPGITDYDMLVPGSNIHPVIDSTQVEWLRLGNVEVTLL
ncbi:baseplate J/gp47 family protein [Citrobacter amalonaticus]|uniref:baseplate J/gp47 family protein n=1 Tax=Citrobacter amalonaticus TaxID=35703 RepID=UPI00215C29FC|nr:baseplate J/gp47 family protein [Citrobacter amalonaticus]MCR9031303.1 baseplate J/gp47 family protein [Citrobacter amalonaticus]MDL4616995.1 baseplate J/gp47 family protein [Citrobacter amalonaticus]MDL4621093.1 baseplate J/gp47 family protein [Citrobacter amalonaticus]